MLSSEQSHWVGSRFRRSLAVFLGAAIIASACTGGGSSGSADRPAGGSSEDTPDGAITPLGKLVLMSEDGSAFGGSLSVVTLTNTGTGEAFDVTVHGEGEATQEEIHLPSGDYVVSAPDHLHHSHIGSHGIVALEPTEITVDPPDDEDPLSIHRDPAVVRFSLDTTPVPVKLLIDDFEPDAVALSWEKIDDLLVEQYVLRLTEGDEPARSPEDGITVDHEPDATSVVVEGLETETTYTFTLFAETANGVDIGHQSLTATTGSFEDKSTAHAVAPNTIVPDDHEDLNAQPLDNGRVGIVLSEDNDDRHSESVVPGLDHEALQEGCHPGLPILVSTEVAGDEAFFGVIESCPEEPPGWMAGAIADGAVTAVVNTDVPLAKVVQHLEINSYEVGGCFDENGSELPSSDERCQFEDADGDGIGDGLEEELDLDNVKITLFWQTGDDFDLRVKCPGCDTFSVLEQGGNYNGNTGRVVESSEGDPNCDGDQFVETFVFNDAQPGEWTIEIVNNGQPEGPFRAGYCLNGWVETAYLEAVVEGEHAIPWGPVPDNRETVYQTTFNIPEPSSFAPPTVDEKPPGFRTPDLAVGSPRFAAKVKCESSGGSTFTPGFGFKPIEKSNLSLHGSTFSWDIRAGVEISVDPQIKVEAGYECSLDVDGKTFQLTKAPVPVNLELTPLLDGSTTGSIELSGPQLSVEFGIHTTGYVSGKIRRCEIDLLPDPPCGITSDNRVNVTPFGHFSHGPATLKVEGELKIGIGVEANLGVGIKNKLVTAKTGFAIGMKPAVATVTGQIGVLVNVAEITEDFDTLEPPTFPAVPPQFDSVLSDDRIAVLKASSTARLSHNGQTYPVIGPVTQTETMTFADVCPNGAKPLLLPHAEPFVLCGDAVCLDAGDNFGSGISTWLKSCNEARCWFNGAIVKSEQQFVECPLSEAEATEFAAHATAQQAYERAKAGFQDAQIAYGRAKDRANQAVDMTEFVAELKACAKARLGAELSVDFTAEAFVLGWGKERTYPIWDKEFPYPGAEFTLGVCSYSLDFGD